MTKPNTKPIKFNVPVPKELKPELASWLLPRTMFHTEVKPVTFNVVTSSMEPPPLATVTVSTVEELLAFVAGIPITTPTGGHPGVVIIATDPPTLEIYDAYRE